VSEEKKKSILKFEGAAKRPSMLSPIMDMIRKLWRKNPKAAVALAAGQQTGVLPETTRAKMIEKSGSVSGFGKALRTAAGVTTSGASLHPKLRKKRIAGGGSEHYYSLEPVKSKLAYKAQIMSVPTAKMVAEWDMKPVEVTKKDKKRVKLKQHAEDWYKYDSPYSAKNAPSGAALSNSHFMAALEAINKGELRTKTQVNKYMHSKVKTAGMPFLQQDRPAKVKEIYSALKRDHPEYSAEKKARIASSKGKYASIDKEAVMALPGTVAFNNIVRKHSTDTVKRLGRQALKAEEKLEAGVTAAKLRVAHNPKDTKAIVDTIAAGGDLPAAAVAHGASRAIRSATPHVQKGYSAARKKMPASTWGKKEWEEAAQKLGSARRIAILVKLSSHPRWR